MPSLRVCIDARLISRVSGGVEQAVIGLAHGLSNLHDGEEEYVFLTHAGADSWIRPYVYGPCQVLQGPRPRQPRRWQAWGKWVLSNFPAMEPIWDAIRCAAERRRVTLPKSDGIVERAAVDIVHFPTQGGFLTDLPSIYQPWDLQHLHLPHFFKSHVRMRREIAYRALCQQASMVSVSSSWCKQDLIRHYGLKEDKVWVVPMAPALSAYHVPSREEVVATKRKYNLPETFLFYPAQTWPHKNHIGLMRALATLRDRQALIIPLVCSGYLNDFYPRIEEEMRRLELAGQVHFLGFVTSRELYCLYRLSRGVVFPSYFEGWGLPIGEAFLAGIPTACSNVTSLPMQAGDAALLFDPDDPEEIADAIRRLWTDELLRETLVRRGRCRVGRFSWDRTARIFRAHYRRIADRALTGEDEVLLATPPLT